MKKALVAGMSGRGFLSCGILLSKDYEVHGIIRRASTLNTDCIDHLYPDLLPMA